MNFGLSDANMAQIVKTLSAFNVSRAVVFGSRAKGNYKYNSDIDICVFGNCDAFGAERVRGALDELPMPYKFDVVSYAEIKTTKLREHIDRVGIEILSAEEAAQYESGFAEMKQGEYKTLEQIRVERAKA